MLWLRCGFCSEEKKSLLLERGRMVKTGIKIFARLRPTKKTTGVSCGAGAEHGRIMVRLSVQ